MLNSRQSHCGFVYLLPKGKVLNSGTLNFVINLGVSNLLHREASGMAVQCSVELEEFVDICCMQVPCCWDWQVVWSINHIQNG